MSPFAPEYVKVRKRTSSDYVKVTPAYRVVLRILNPNAKMKWTHWIKEANNGRGMGANCPGRDVCPIDIEYKDASEEDRRANQARKRFMVNVLDRTPYTVCDACNTPTPGKKCQNCGADLKKNTFTPLNKVKILEGGPQLFVQTLNAVDRLQQEEANLQITDYDITFSAQGEGRDKRISAIPGAASEISDEDLVDKETGEKQELFDLDLLAEPTPIEEIDAMRNGATVADLNRLRGIE